LQLSERRQELSRRVVTAATDREAARALIELEELAIREERDRRGDLERGNVATSR